MEGVSCSEGVATDRGGDIDSAVGRCRLRGSRGEGVLRRLVIAGGSFLCSFGFGC